MTHEPLPDRWSTRDLPVLLAAAKVLDLGASVTPQELAEAEGLGLDADAVEIACEALVPTYITAGRTPGRLGAPKGGLILTGLTERGRRATGLWPDGETAVEQLLDALRQAEDLTDDPDEKTALRKAGGQLATVSRSVVAEVIAAVVTRQAGL